MRLGKTGFCLSLVGVLACWAWPNGRSDGLRGELAVVERERLWKCHGSYPQLQELDWKLGRLQSERIELLTRAQMRCDRLLQEQEAHRLWDLQRSQMQAQMEQATQEFKGRAEREMRAVHARFERQLKAAARVPDRDLQMMATAAVMRFRLEKQKELSARLQARRRQLDELVARLEDDLGRRFQPEKVALQVRLQAHEEEAARARLSAIADEVEECVAARRRLAETELRDYTSIEEGQLAIEVGEYEQGLRRELTPAAPDLAALQRQERHQLRSVQQIRQAELVQVVRNLEASARARFQDQLAGLRGRHDKSGELLPEAFLEPGERARLHHLPELMREARRRRQEVHAHMSSGIARVVAERAGERGVITHVRLNLELEDLTDVSLAGVSQL